MNYIRDKWAKAYAHARDDGVIRVGVCGGAPAAVARGKPAPPPSRAAGLDAPAPAARPWSAGVASSWQTS